MLNQVRRHAFRILPLLMLFALLLPGQPAPAEDHGVAGPKAIYIIRHGEKPDSKDDPNLAPKGVERAKALVHAVPDHICTPDFIVATAPSKHSSRPLQTVQPLADSMHLKIQDEFEDADFAKLAHQLLTDPKYFGKTILICWHHGEIPDLAKALGEKDAPDKWKSEDFDRVWELTYTDGQVQYKNLPEKALPGDSDN